MASERGKLLNRLSQLFDSNRRLLATVESWDNGKPSAVALNEDLAELAEVFVYYGGYAYTVYG